MLDPAWPDKPFIEIAKKHRLAKVLYRHHDPTLPINRALVKDCPIEHFHSSVEELKSLITNKHPDNVSRFTRALCKAAKIVPMTMLVDLVNKLTKQNSKVLFALLRQLISLRKTGHLAISFNINSVLEKGLPIDYSFADYLKDTCVEAESNMISPPPYSTD